MKTKSKKAKFLVYIGHDGIIDGCVELPDTTPLPLDNDHAFVIEAANQVIAKSKAFKRLDWTK